MSNFIKSKMNSRVFSLSTVLLIVICIIINHIGAKLALMLSLPVFLDSIGTILGAALGGMFPGIIIGFFSNLINSISDPITVYYGMVSVLIAVAAAYLSYKGFLKRPGKSLICVLIFAVIGGIGGSLITWFLYGLNIGEGISAPFALYFCNTLHVPAFTAQLIADFAIDVLDKFISVAAVFFALTVAPARIMGRTPLGYIYSEDETAPPVTAAGKTRKYNARYTISGKITAIISVAAIVLSTISTVIGFWLFHESVDATYEQIVYSATQLMLDTLDGDDMQKYAETLRTDEQYTAYEESLRVIRDAFPEIEYVYVVRVENGGCTVLFDLDTPDVVGSELGERWDIEPDFEPQSDRLYAGEPIDPIVTRGQYGWLLTVYQPIKSSAGATVAYAAADITMERVYGEQYMYIMRILSLLFGASMIIISFAIRFVRLKIVLPINLLIDEADRFAYDEQNDAAFTFDSEEFKTGDEIEELSRALAQSAQNTRAHLTEIREKAEVITRLQDNIIVSFSEMVENRDEMTGGHILRTAEYVRAIGEELRREEKHPDILTPTFLSDAYKSAPLHDIGKIKISDTILNKPGKLTPEEFDIMKTHTTEGGAILRQVLANIEEENYLTVAIDMAVNHHEKWDGTGYPAGLRGEDIPLCARLMAVADVFDALLSKRSYKEPFPFDEAVSIIREGAGGHFDPAVVDAFLHITDQLQEISTRKFK